MGVIQPPRRSAKRRPKRDVPSTVERTDGVLPDDSASTDDEFGAVPAADLKAVQRRREVEASLSSEKGLMFKPGLRRARLYAETELVRTLDGAPMMTKSGQAVVMTLNEAVIQAWAKDCINPENPNRHKDREQWARFFIGTPPVDQPGDDIPIIAPPQQQPPPPPPSALLPVAADAPTSEATAPSEALMDKAIALMGLMKDAATSAAMARERPVAIDVKAELTQSDRSGGGEGQ